MDRSFVVLKDLLAGTSNWEELGRCREADPEQWYPEKGFPTRYAKAICRRCPVRARCLKNALDTREPWGIWGGLTEHERQAILRKGPAAVAIAVASAAVDAATAA